MYTYTTSVSIIYRTELEAYLSLHSITAEISYLDDTRIVLGFELEEDIVWFKLCGFEQQKQVELLDNLEELKELVETYRKIFISSEIRLKGGGAKDGKERI